MEKIRVLMVCLGNICRSPMADVVLQERIADAGLDDRVSIDSSGTGGWHVGGPMDRRAAATLTAAGYDATRRLLARLRKEHPHLGFIAIEDGLSSNAPHIEDLMAYDMHWNGEKTTNLHSALFHDPADPSKPPADTHYASHAVQDFLRAGVPARKVVLGVPFYGKGWTGVSATNHGLYQPAKNASKSAPEYRNLKALPESADRQFYPKLATCSVWNNGEFFSYDCPQAMRLKWRFVRQHQFGGVMFWEIGQDTNDAELLKSLVGR